VEGTVLSYPIDWFFFAKRMLRFRVIGTGVGLARPNNKEKDPNPLWVIFRLSKFEFEIWLITPQGHKFKRLTIAPRSPEVMSRVAQG
jgi:hypothetical protein